MEKVPGTECQEAVCVPKPGVGGEGKSTNLTVPFQLKAATRQNMGFVLFSWDLSIQLCPWTSGPISSLKKEYRATVLAEPQLPAHPPAFCTPCKLHMPKDTCRLHFSNLHKASKWPRLSVQVLGQLCEDGDSFPKSQCRERPREKAHLPWSARLTSRFILFITHQ